jgi:hypothetical protein
MIFLGFSTVVSLPELSIFSKEDLSK